MKKIRVIVLSRSIGGGWPTPNNWRVGEREKEEEEEEEDIQKYE